MSETSDTIYRSVPETTPGITPANPRFREFCHTGVGLGATPVTQASQKICNRTNSRAPGAPRFLGLAPGGDVSFEFSFEHTQEFPGLLQKAWDQQKYVSNKEVAGAISSFSSGTFDFATSLSTAFSVGDLVKIVGCGDIDAEGVYRVSEATMDDIEIDGAPSTFGSLDFVEIRRCGFRAASGDIETSVTGGNGLISTTADFTNFDIEVGDWIKLGGTATANAFSTAVLNDFCRISAVSANRLDFDRVPVGFAADAGTGKEIHVFLGDRITDGRDKQTYTGQAEYAAEDGSRLIRTFPGMYPGTFSLSGENRENAQILTGSISYLGIGEPNDATSQISGAVEIPALLTQSMNSGEDAARIAEGGVIASGEDDAVVNFTLSIDNTNQRLGGWGSNTGVGVRSGDLNISGIFEAYFNDFTLQNKSTGQTRTEIDTVLKDDRWNYALAIDLPNIRLNGDPPAQGRNNVHTVPYNYTAHPDAELGYAIRFQRFWAQG